MDGMSETTRRMRAGAALAVALIATLTLAASAPAATDPGCTTLHGDDATVPGECRVSAAVSVAGTVTVGETLHMMAGGAINVGVGGLALNITSGDLVMESGSVINGSVPTTCPNTGRAVAVTLGVGNVEVMAGSAIRSNGCSGGFIRITTGSPGEIGIDGTIESVGNATGAGGTTQLPGGGPITVKAGCGLTVGDTGLVSSRGQAAGADLVHLEGCAVTINGRVESTAPGQATPHNPANSCSDATTIAPRRNIVTRSGKPQSSTGCVEIWSGTTLLIDSTSAHAGEVNADVGFTGGTTGRGWIDLLANGNIDIIDGAGNDRIINACGASVFISFAVHANGGLCQAQDDGGLILIQSYQGDVGASGDAIQADGSNPVRFSGGKGGQVRVEAHGDISLAANVFARGDFLPPGFGNGGQIGPTHPAAPPIVTPAPIRAFNGALNWTSGSGEATPTGSAVLLAQRGEINLQACLGVNTAGASFPVNGVPVLPYPNVLTAACGGGPALPAYASGFPSTATCALRCLPPPANVIGMKFNDLSHDGFKDPNEPPLNGWQIHVFGTDSRTGAPVHEHFVTQNVPGIGQGVFTFTLNPGTYTVCETLEPNWTQTAPGAVPPPALLADCSGHTHAGSIVPGPRGYSFTIVGHEVFSGNDFGNFPEPATCTGNTTLTAPLTRVVCDSDPNCGAVPHYPTVQAAYDALTGPDEIIGVFKNTTENVLFYTQFPGTTIASCAVSKITAASNTLPAVRVTSTDPLIIVALDTAGGSDGWLIESDNHEIRGVRTSGAAGCGIHIASTGDSNKVSCNSVSTNQTGICVDGTLNNVRCSSVTSNTGNGVVLTGDNNSFQNANVDLNHQNGVVVRGSNNTVKSTVAGSDKGKGNLLDGILVTGPFTTLDGNVANANGGNGFTLGCNGSVCGTNATWNGNQSNQSVSGGIKENARFEYSICATCTGGVNLGNNKADTIVVPKTTAPTKCPTFPAASTNCE